MLFYPYALVDRRWVPLGERWVSASGASETMAAAHRMGATEWAAYIWDGWSMTWSVGI